MVRLNHIHIKVKDAKAAADWFIKMFGSKIVDEWTSPDGHIVRTSLDGIPINFTRHPNAEDLPPGYSGVHLGLEHFGLEVDDLDALLAKAQKNGVKIVQALREDTKVGVRFAFIEGPDATRIEVMQWVKK